MPEGALSFKIWIQVKWFKKPQNVPKHELAFLLCCPFESSNSLNSETYSNITSTSFSNAGSSVLSNIRKSHNKCGALFYYSASLHSHQLTAKENRGASGRAPVSLSAILYAVWLTDFWRVYCLFNSVLETWHCGGSSQSSLASARRLFSSVLACTCEVDDVRLSLSATHNRRSPTKECGRKRRAIVTRRNRKIRSLSWAVVTLKK